MIEQILKRLEAKRNDKSVEGMKKFGIVTKNVYGVSVPELRKIAREVGKSHKLALKLWEIDSRETRILASMVDEPNKVTEEQMENWAKDFDNWEICDQVCQNLFVYSKYAIKKAIEWSEREEEFVKRAGFTLMAVLAVKDKKADNSLFEKFLPIIKREATDERNFVKKAVNWALRQIGKRNLELNKRALEIASEILQIDSKSAKWIARDAIRELKSEKIQNKLKEKQKKLSDKDKV